MLAEEKKLRNYSKQLAIQVICLNRKANKNSHFVKILEVYEKLPGKLATLNKNN